MLNPFVWTFTTFIFIFTFINACNLIYMLRPYYLKLKKRCNKNRKTNPKQKYEVRTQVD